jgi:ankyrin repeat protein
MIRWLDGGGAICLASLVACASAADSPIDFQKDVAPILQQHCVDCHGPELQMSELRLDQRKFALADDGRGLIKPGKSSESLLIHRLTDKQLGILMPPTFPFFPGEKGGLAEAKISVLKAWIDQGAAWPEGVNLASQRAAESPATRALFTAIRSGQHQAVSELLDKDKDLVQARAAGGDTPLMQAAAYSDERMLQQLLERGADATATNRDGATALIRAAGDLKKVQLLLDRGADLHAKSTYGRTAILAAAAWPGNAATVKLLLDRGAKLNDSDQFGETCLTSACKRGDTEMARLLLSRGANPVAGGRPPLVWAAEEGNSIETVRCLLDHQPPQPPPVISAALSSAAARGPVELVRLLLDRGADPSAPSPIAGYTPLMWAAYSDLQSAEVVKLLLDKGADRAGKGANGETPLSLARKFGSTEIAALLEQGRAGEAAPAAAASGDKPLPDLREAIAKSLQLLQKCGPTFFSKSGCVACHQQSVTSLALAAARVKGLKVDEQTAREQVAITALTGKTYVERFLQRADHPAGSAPAAGYIALGLAAEKYPADEITDAMIFELIGRQHTDGSWTAFGHRPPLEASPISATALALRAIQLYGPPSLKPQLDERLARASKWLAAASAATNTDQCFRLLGLAWSKVEPSLIAAQREAVLKSQRADGGWAQHPALASDAYATGLTLFALHESGQLEPADEAYQRGVAFLRRTQLDDGSWHVKTHAFPFQAYFESGFPHGHDQWISAAATGFATVALIQSLP